MPDATVWRRCLVWLSVVTFFGFIFLYAQRVGMSVAVVCMVNQTALRLERQGGMMENGGINTSVNEVSSTYSIQLIQLILLTIVSYQ